jgi:hypothetical protein
MVSGIASIVVLLAGLASLICFILLLVQMFKHGSTGMGVACILFLCCGLGQLIALIYGWVKVGDWKITKLMTMYTIAFAIMVIGIGVNPASYQFIQENLTHVTPGATGRDGDGNGSKFAARVEAALAINDFALRNATLASLANDAAAAGDAEVVNSCLANINDFALRNTTAHSAAMSLARAGKMQAATDVAKSINDFNLRNRALSSLAKGDFGK